MSYDWINNSGHFGGGGNYIRRLLHLALRTWVSRLGSLVASGHGLCGQFRHRKSLWPVPPQKMLQERRRTDGQTQQVTLYIRLVGTLCVMHRCVKKHQRSISSPFSMSGSEIHRFPIMLLEKKLSVLFWKHLAAKLSLPCPFFSWASSTNHCCCSYVYCSYKCSRA
jgi:hypothetical protein